MPNLTVQIKARNNDVLGADLRQRVARFAAAEEQARKSAATLASQTSRSIWAGRTNKRDVVLRPTPFAGRSSTRNQMGSFIKWRIEAGAVALNMAELDQRAPHWIIHEIGTGKRATVKSGGAPNPRGRARSGATYVRTVKSQAGRPISSALVFTKGGAYSPPPGSGRDALVWRSMLKTKKGLPTGPARGMRIQKEIAGQHFIQKGGETGFRQYKSSTLAAAREAFRKGSR